MKNASLALALLICGTGRGRLLVLLPDHGYQQRPRLLHQGLRAGAEQCPVQGRDDRQGDDHSRWPTSGRSHPRSTRPTSRSDAPANGPGMRPSSYCHPRLARIKSSVMRGHRQRFPLVVLGMLAALAAQVTSRPQRGPRPRRRRPTRATSGTGRGSPETGVGSATPWPRKASRSTWTGSRCSGRHQRGREKDVGYWGTFEYTLNLDTQKLGALARRLPHRLRHVQLRHHRHQRLRRPRPVNTAGMLPRWPLTSRPPRS